jgi:hypothetical protein
MKNLSFSVCMLLGTALIFGVEYCGQGLPGTGVSQNEVTSVLALGCKCANTATQCTGANYGACNASTVGNRCGYCQGSQYNMTSISGESPSCTIHNNQLCCTHDYMCQAVPGMFWTVYVCTTPATPTPEWAVDENTLTLCTSP